MEKIKMSEIKNGYKILKIHKDGELTSCTFDVGEEGCLIYNKDGKTERKDGNGAIAVFKKYESVLRFMNEYTYTNRVIVGCRYKPSETKQLFYLYCCNGKVRKSEMISMLLPEGTDFADWVELIW
jgi:hypothetical protein